MICINGANLKEFKFFDLGTPALDDPAADKVAS